MRSRRAFPFAALVVVAFVGCGRSDLADELLVVEPGLDAGDDFDSAIGDDETKPQDASTHHDASPPRDASMPHDASARDAEIAEEDASEFVDSASPPFDGGEGECGPVTCASGCCYGNVCAVGTQDIACGAMGGKCLDCTALSKGPATCTHGFCEF
jgi:hypothetical protein